MMKMEFTRVMRGKTVFSSQLNSEFLRGKLSLFGYLCVCVCVCTLSPTIWLDQSEKKGTGVRGIKQEEEKERKRTEGIAYVGS